MSAPKVFDEEHYQGLNSSRAAVVGGFLSILKDQMNLETALDVGSGLGFFSAFLHSLGFQVTAVDGREENAKEGKRRYPEINFLTGNAEDLALVGKSTFDLVLCFGLLYHLENPFRALRNLHALTRKILLVESMIAPGTEPSMQLVDEERAEDQGLSYVAFYPTEACLTKMLYRAGFAFVYEFEKPPDHSLFHASLWRRKQRTMLVASNDPLQATVLSQLPDLRGSWEILSTPRERFGTRLNHIVGHIRIRRPQASPPNQDVRER